MSGLPQTIILKSVESVDQYLHYTKSGAFPIGCVRSGVDLQSFHPSALIDVEVSQYNSRYVHLRFSYTNKYWGRDPGTRRLRATSDQPIDDQSNPACTVFEVDAAHGKLINVVYFIHVQSRTRVRLDRFHTDPLIVEGTAATLQSIFTFTDWNTIVRLPKYVTFKGVNNKYLKGLWYRVSLLRIPYLHFSGDDYNHEDVAYELFPYFDGHFRIKSEFYGLLWRDVGDWICGDAPLSNMGNSTNADVNTLFWPVKVNDNNNTNNNTIALRSAGTNAFCRIGYNIWPGPSNYLQSTANNIINEVRLVVEELVLNRRIYNVRYVLEDARIYDETPFLAGTSTANNATNSDSTLAVTISYTDTSSSSFAHTLSVELGVATTLETRIPFIVDGKIELSSSITNSFEWGSTSETSTTSEVTYTVTVPPMSRVTVNFIGTEGKSSVPFTYTQMDQRSNNGSYLTSHLEDGMFNGINSYNYHFEQLPVQPL